MKNSTKSAITTFLLVASTILILTLTSCSTRNGYGCHGRESWKHMVRRINS